MQHDLRITAKKYALSLFELLQTQSIDLAGLDSMEQALTAVGVFLSKDKEFGRFIVNPSVSIEQRKVALTSLAEVVSPGKSFLPAFLNTILQNGRVAVIPEAVEAFHQLVEDYKRLLKLEVSTAFALDPQEQGQLEAQLRTAVGGAAAGQLSFSWFVEPEILGGLKVRCGDKIIDRSIENSLQQFAQALAD